MEDGIYSLPMVGDPNGFGVLSGNINNFRTESTNSRDIHTEFIPTANSLYLNGTPSPGETAHVYNRCQSMINSFAMQAAKSPPVVSTKIVGRMELGPAIADVMGIATTANSAFLETYFQGIFDAVWSARSKAERWFADVVRDIKVNGWQDTLIDWIKDEKRAAFYRIPPLQWYKDPTSATIEEACYMGLDWPIDSQWAKRQYPHLATIIDENSTRAVQNAPASNAYSTLYINQVYARNVVTMTFWWIRNREMPMTDQEAIASGLVESRTPQPMEAPLGEVTDGVAPAPETPEMLPAEPLDALFLVETGEPTSPEAPNWPTKRVLSQTIQVGGQVVEDIECPSNDIPVTTGFNVQIPYQPYGQSALMPVASLQVDLNTVHGSLVKHATYYGAPYGVADKRIQEEMPEGLKNQYIEPGKIYFVDLDAGQRASDLIEMQNPPPLPATLPVVKREINEAFDAASAFSSVRQGNTPTANASGELVNSLLSASMTNTEYTFLTLNSMVERAAMCVIGYILRDFDVNDYRVINRDFDEATTALIMDLLREVEWHVELEATWDKDKKQQENLALYTQGVIDLETLHDSLGLDHKLIMQRMSQAALGAVPSDEASGKPNDPLKGESGQTQQGDKPGSLSASESQ